MEYEKNLMQTLVDSAFIDMFKNYETRIEMIDDCKDTNLNHFWNRNKFLDFWGLNKMPYNQHYHEEKHGNAKFLLADNLKFEQDSNHYAKHGTYEGQTKVTDMGNDIVTDFFVLQPSHDLDLTWMKPKDIFRLHDSIQYRNLQNIAVNVDNLTGSSLNLFSARYEADVDLNLNLIVNAKKSKLNSQQQVAAFRSFFESFDADNERSHRISSVMFDGFDKTTLNILVSYLEEKGIKLGKRQHLTFEPNSQAIKIEKAADKATTTEMGQ